MNPNTIQKRKQLNTSCAKASNHMNWKINDQLYNEQWHLYIFILFQLPAPNCINCNKTLFICYVFPPEKSDRKDLKKKLQ